MSNIARRLSSLRRDLHDLKTTIRNHAHPDDPEWYIEQVEAVLVRDQERILRRDQNGKGELV
jgi:hypothetical protein